jgi:hypothetical protein
METLYFVHRVKIDVSGAQTQSTQTFTDKTQARKRWHNILAADLDSQDIAYELVQVLRSDGICTDLEIIDNRTAAEEG